jgi:hypothetical protein
MFRGTQIHEFVSSYDTSYNLQGKGSSWNLSSQTTDSGDGATKCLPCQKSQRRNPFAANIAIHHYRLTHSRSASIPYASRLR